jgi:hypothetical protein
MDRHSHEARRPVVVDMSSLQRTGSSENGHGSARLLGLLVIFPLLAITVMAVAPLEAAHAQAPDSSVTVNAVNQFGQALPRDYYTVSQAVPYGPYNGQGETVAATGVTGSTFEAMGGNTYSLQVYDYGSCTFSHWSDGVVSDPVAITATGAALSFTAVYNCVGAVIENSGTITIYDHRTPQSDWAPCFALVCDLGTGPGASMYVGLYSSNGTLVGTGFSNENGLTFTGLNPSATYYIYPSDCDLCHGSTHDVLFSHWGDGNTTRPLAVTANDTSLNAWYTCTNGCGGV